MVFGVLQQQHAAAAPPPVAARVSAAGGLGQGHLLPVSSPRPASAKCLSTSSFSASRAMIMSCKFLQGGHVVARRLEGGHTRRGRHSAGYRRSVRGNRPGASLPRATAAVRRDLVLQEAARIVHVRAVAAGGALDEDRQQRLHHVVRQLRVRVAIGDGEQVPGLRHHADGGRPRWVIRRSRSAGVLMVRSRSVLEISFSMFGRLSRVRCRISSWVVGADSAAMPAAAGSGWRLRPRKSRALDSNWLGIM